MIRVKILSLLTALDIREAEREIRRLEQAKERAVSLQNQAVAAEVAIDAELSDERDRLRAFLAKQRQLEAVEKTA